MAGRRRVRWGAATGRGARSRGAPPRAREKAGRVCGYTHARVGYTVYYTGCSIPGGAAGRRLRRRQAGFPRFPPPPVSPPPPGWDPRLGCHRHPAAPPAAAPLPRLHGPGPDGQAGAPVHAAPRASLLPGQARDSGHMAGFRACSGVGDGCHGALPTTARVVPGLRPARSPGCSCRCRLRRSGSKQRPLGRRSSGL